MDQNNMNPKSPVTPITDDSAAQANGGVTVLPPMPEDFSLCLDCGKLTKGRVRTCLSCGSANIKPN